MNVVATGCDVVALEVERNRGHHDVGIHRRDLSLHGLGVTGRTRGVLHELSRQAFFRAPGRLSFEHISIWVKAGHFANRNASAIPSSPDSRSSSIAPDNSLTTASHST